MARGRGEGPPREGFARGHEGFFLIRGMVPGNPLVPLGTPVGPERDVDNVDVCVVCPGSLRRQLGFVRGPTRAVTALAPGPVSSLPRGGEQRERISSEFSLVTTHESTGAQREARGSNCVPACAGFDEACGMIFAAGPMACWVWFQNSPVPASPFSLPPTAMV